MIHWNDFEKIDIRTGTIISATNFVEAKKPAYKLTIDFGEFGIKKSSAQITNLYELEMLVGKQILAVVNFPPKQIANYISECLVLGVYDSNHQVILLQPDRQVANGMKVG
ncbi:MAG TPA: tRNA-binding protein [Chitinophagaceae bacterium]|nr:tRNA-binding protein [Chitinophagaceae bacterium]MCC6635238.1 tRNA-binding protein [Chitinophagaceae bacterium]HMZ45546.1 tRNA-binding protein [Chitinophagaceae bacterium]HNL82673.1 tRNA-binding protein [Chitinophagaceae bacterium]HNM34987.1 tRNA-binding protein [Chitinophagaceae bacterium]